MQLAFKIIVIILHVEFCYVNSHRMSVFCRTVMIILSHNRAVKINFIRSIKYLKVKFETACVPLDGALVLIRVSL